MNGLKRGFKSISVMKKNFYLMIGLLRIGMSLPEINKNFTFLTCNPFLCLIEGYIYSKHSEIASNP